MLSQNYSSSKLMPYETLRKKIFETLNKAEESTENAEMLRVWSNAGQFH
jgi:hypothetical protein